MKLHYAGAPGEGYGWGVCNANLARELGRLVELCDPADADALFTPLQDNDLNPFVTERARLNLAYTFFESPLGPNAAQNAARFDVVFGGSTWCLDRMRERGITNARLLMQGIDREIFRSLPRERDGAFRVFSGGKFEWRKGQDLVIAAFAAFAKAHPEANAHLVCAWFNPWGELIWEMGNSPYLLFEGVDGDDQPKLFSKLLTVNGVPEGQFTMLPQLAQRDLAREMAGTDCGLFPNRCEGGTNLVLMEYLGCGRPAVANLATGHADLAGADIIPIPTTLDDRQWAVQDPADVLRALETAYARFRVGELVARSATPGSWTWERAARTIVEALGELDAASVKRASAAS